MFGFNFGELLIVGVIALVVLKPEDFRKLARNAGLWTVTAQRYIQGMLAGLRE